MTVVRVTEIKTVEIEPCIPVNPVMLQWLNKKGGWDRYVFGIQQEEGVETSAGSIINIPIEDYETARTTQQARGIKSFPKMILGADNLNENRARGIAGILDAAEVLILISWDQVNAPVWRTVNVDKGSYSTFNTGEKKQSIEFSITLPENIVQQL